MSCEKFCLKQENGADGKLYAFIGGKEGDKGNPFKPGLQECPIGFTCNPSDVLKTENVIKNGGRFTICTANRFKYMKVEGCL